MAADSVHEHVESACCLLGPVCQGEADGGGRGAPSPEGEEAAPDEPQVWTEGAVFLQRKDPKEAATRRQGKGSPQARARGDVGRGQA